MSYIKLVWVALAALSLSACADREYTPVAGTSAETIFAEACASCHGDAGAGKFGFLFKLTDSEYSHPDSVIAALVIQGGNNMPAFPNMGQKNAEALGAYINAQ